MATTARQPKPSRKGMPEPASRSPCTCMGHRTRVTTFSPGAANARLPNGVPPASPGAFPPLGHPNGIASPAPTPAPKDAPHDRVLAQLSGLTGTTITLSTKTNIRYEGSVLSTSAEGDTTGVTLKDVKDLTNPGAPLRETLFVAATNIEQWTSGPADAKAPNGESFKTDTDISQKIQRRERELQAWQPATDDTNGTAPAPAPGAGTGGRDELTFGPGATTGGTSWDQFAANERLFGVRANFDENVYTTPLDRNAPDFKERERKAQMLANEILGDKYGAVVRGANAYVPPGARKGPLPTGTGSKSDIPKLAVNAPDGATVSSAQTETSTATPSKTGSPAPNAANQPAVDAVPAFREFVSSEKDRLMKKKQAIMKNEMEKRVADLVKFSQSFKLNKPIPDDLVPILAKDEDKQRQIREKSTKDAGSSHARSIGAPAGAATTAVPIARASPGAAPPLTKLGSETARQPASKASAASGAAKAPTAPSKPGEAAKGRISMVIQAIPPFKGKSAGPAPSGGRTNGNTNGAPAASPLSPNAQNRLNVNASSFRPTVKAFSPPGGSPNPNGTSSSASPKTKPSDSSASQSPQAQGPPNPFFGTRVTKKGPPLVNIKDDFNPFKYNKVVKASEVSASWPFNGKRYMQMFPPPPAPPQQQSPHMAPPGPPPPMPPQSYEDDAAAQAAARGYVYAYPTYVCVSMWYLSDVGDLMQPMMPGMAPPPPGAYMPGPFMQPMPYPHMPPPNGTPIVPFDFDSAPQAYMQPPPPGSYPPPPNGAGPRPSMPPTPIPSHAHPYYHQSPQLQHAVPYPMMMPPPGAGGPPHPYDPSQAPPVQMGGVNHG
ncbi:hypothetical protein B0H21DRAFT_725331 [Amylocystis lapponica]|nr:hypothetical protein B0H21DRAFT_725331 [Amylocystis lapponica]